MTRIGMELMARGIVFMGSLVSAAAVPTQLDATKREEGDLEAQDEAKCAVREHPAVVPDVGQTRNRTLGRGEVGADHDYAGGDQRQDCDDLDNGEPELQLSERRDCWQVQAEQEQRRHQGGEPQWSAGGQHLDIGSDRYDVRDADDHPVEPVGP